jgi:phosphohistidine phosphatase
MTRTLILIRHAKSDWDDPALDDHDRPLNAVVSGARRASAHGWPNGA